MKVMIEEGAPKEVGLRLDETTPGEVYVIVDGGAGFWIGHPIVACDDERFVYLKSGQTFDKQARLRVRPLHDGECVILTRD